MHINENIKNRANFAYGIMQKLKTHPALRAELPCFSFLIDKKGKGNLPKSRQSFEPRLLNKSILFSLVKLVFRLQKRLFIDTQVIITGPAVPLGTRLLDLGSKLFPSTIQRMLNNSLTRFMHNHLK